LHNLPIDFQQRVGYVISTDPFGPFNIPDPEKAEQIGRERTKHALELLHGLPNQYLYVCYTPNLRSGKEEQRRAEHYLKGYLPDTVLLREISTPTKSYLPCVSNYIPDASGGYGIKIDGSLHFKRYHAAEKWKQIGNIYQVDASKIQIPYGV